MNVIQFRWAKWPRHVPVELVWHDLWSIDIQPVLKCNRNVIVQENTKYIQNKPKRNENKTTANNVIFHNNDVISVNHAIDQINVVYNTLLLANIYLIEQQQVFSSTSSSGSW